MSDLNPLVSIIMPSYNSSKFIAYSIKSIQDQSYINWELLITDDNSSDNTIDIVKAFSKYDGRIKHYRLSKNSGPGVARNNSISKATGVYIAFCDSDDLWKPEKLKNQVAYMKDNNFALTYSSYDVVDEKGVIIGEVFPPYRLDYYEMLKNNYIGCLTAMYDSSMIGKVFMPTIRKRQDWALWLSILKKIDFAYGMDEKLCVYRDRKKSISSKKIDLLKYNFQLYHGIEKYSKIKSMMLVIRFIYFYYKKKIG